MTGETSDPEGDPSNFNHKLKMAGHTHAPERARAHFLAAAHSDETVTRSSHAWIQDSVARVPWCQGPRLHNCLTNALGCISKPTPVHLIRKGIFLATHQERAPCNRATKSKRIPIQTYKGHARICRALSKSNRKSSRKRQWNFQHRRHRCRTD